MSKTWKRLALFAGIFVGTVLTVLLVLPYMISMERFKEPLSQRISMMLNRPVSMEKIRISLIPRIGLDLVNFRVQEKFPEDGDFLKVDTFNLHLRLFPLLKGEIQVGEIDLKNPVVQIIRHPNGRFNYQTLGAPETIRADREYGTPESIHKPVPVSSPGPGTRLSQSPWVSGLLISRARISNGTIHYQDRSRASSTVQDVREIDLTLNNISLQEPVFYSLSARFGKGDGIHFEMDGEGHPNLSDQSLTLENNRIGLEKIEFLLGGSIHHLFSEIDLNLTLQSKTFMLEDLFHLAEASGSPLPPDLTLNGDAPLHMAVTGPFRKLGISGNVNLDQTRYAYADLLYKEKGTPAKLSVKSTMTEEAITLHDLSLNNGPSDLSLQGIITKKKPMEINLSIFSNRLEGQTWLFPAASAAGIAKTGGNSNKQKATAPFGPPPVKAHVNVQIKKGEIKGYRFSNLKGMANFKEGILRISPLSFQMAEGTYQGQFNLDLNHPDPPFQMSTRIEEMNLTSLLTAKPSLQEVIQGRLFTDLSVKGKGLSWPEIQKNIGGRGSFKITDGKLPALKLKEEVTELLGFSPQVFGTGEGTTFKTLDGSFVIDHGKVHTDDLHLKLDGMVLAGQGYVSLDQSLSFNLTAEIESEKVRRGSLASGLGKTFLKARNGNIIIPMKVSGTVAAPKIKPDTEAVAKLATQNLLDKVQDQIQKKGGVEDLLKGLFQTR